MKHIWLRRLILLVLGLAVIGAIFYALRPQPIPADFATVERGTLRISIDEDGVTRIRERYVISAPLSGRLLRVGLDPGDDVARGRLLLIIEPSDPSLLDARARAEAIARSSAAKAAVLESEAKLARVNATLEDAQAELEDQQQMFDRGASTRQELDDAELLVRVRTQERASANFAVEVASFQLDLAEAALAYSSDSEDGQDLGQLEINAPCDGRVLRLFQESEGYVTAGTPLLEFGDTRDIEIVVDVLSTDAVQVSPGDRVVLNHWGGEEELNGQVRVVEPAAFTKVSSLGVEEQRVNVIIDLIDPALERHRLGDGFRVEAQIVIWEEPDVLMAPSSAAFKTNEGWSVYRVINGQAMLTPVDVGRRNGQHIQILEGLDMGEELITYPSDAIEHEAAVISR